ncbi:MAG: hypothetical protein KF760_04350 [Candidatus Eremiobacteraeota bacterium]|nr:hypothetical protein [Candidatus Eremiobacteraeota bacterium]MCW5867146.1 hypothetical protein [Candidatus Eremiobacteraeota bacterium]
MQQSSVDSILNDLSSEGLQIESGVFTLDPRAQALKYGVFLRRHPFLPIAKMIQAAVALGGRSVEIHWSAQEWKVEFEPESGCAAELAETLQGLKRPLSRGLQHLRRALEITEISEGTGFLFELSLPDATLAVVGLQKASSGWNVHLAEAQSNPRCRLVMKRLQPATWKPETLRSGRPRLRKFLSERFGLCPIPVFLNGAALERGDLEARAWARLGPAQPVHSISHMLYQVRRFFRAFEATRLDSGQHSVVQAHFRWLCQELEFSPYPLAGFASLPLARQRCKYFNNLQVSHPEEDAQPTLGHLYTPNQQRRKGLPVRQTGFFGRLQSQATALEAEMQERGSIALGSCGTICEPIVETLSLPAGCLLPELDSRCTLTGSFTNRLSLHQPGVRLGSALGIASYPAGPSLAFPVLDGLLLNPCELEGVPGSYAFLAGPWQTDLSQLEILQDEACRRKLQKVQARLLKLVKKGDWKTPHIPDKWREAWADWIRGS